MGALISYPDNTLTATLSGGSFNASFPLINLKDPLLSHTARTANALAASSTFNIDLGATKDIRVLALCRHNISAAGTIRATGYDDAGMTTLIADTGAILAWPETFTAKQTARYPNNWTYIFTDAVTVRYWQIEIIDTTNAAGYIELGRCWLGETEFEGDISFGYSNGFASFDTVDRSLGGVQSGNKRTPQRALNAAFNYLTAEERREIIVLQKVLTETDEAYWITDVTDAAPDMLIDAFPCFLSKPSPVVSASFNINQMPISILERV